jgi:hypothetical protein
MRVVQDSIIVKAPVLFTMDVSNDLENWPLVMHGSRPD